MNLKYFTNCLDKYQVKYVRELLDYTPLPNRNGQAMTVVIAHTEGLEHVIPGNAPRNIRDYFNNQANGVNTHGYIDSDGVLHLYVAMENGSYGAGNPPDNIRAGQFETQDNGRWRDPKTYTKAQYETWSRVFCACVDFARAKYGTKILFKHHPNGLLRHNDIIKDRACPGALDTDRIIREAKKLWGEVNAKPVTPKSPNYLVQCFDVEGKLSIESSYDSLTKAEVEYKRLLSKLKPKERLDLAKEDDSKEHTQVLTTYTEPEVVEPSQPQIEPIPEPTKTNYLLKFLLSIYGAIERILKGNR